MDRFDQRWRTIWIAGLLSAVTLATFWPVRHHDFVKYDDDIYITANPHVSSGLRWENVEWAFRPGYASNWHPLTWLSHMLDAQLFGVQAGAHHFNSLLFHAANTVLLFLLLQRLTGARWRSALVAALFALHPLHVESVAWAAERKDVLSTLFFFLTIWAYVSYAESPRSTVHGPQSAGPGPNSAIQSINSEIHDQEPEARRSAPEPSHGTRNTEPAPRITHHATRITRLRQGYGELDGGQALHAPRSTLSRSYYVLSLLFFALGLMSKPMLVTVPFVLLLLDYWPLGRLQIGDRESWVQGPAGRLWVEKAPFFCLTILSSVVTVLAQEKGHAVSVGLPLYLRAANAVASYWKYLGKTFWPANLAVFYPHPDLGYFFPHPTPLHPASVQWPRWQIAAAAALLLAVSAVVVLRRKQQPWLAVGWFWYVGTLAPVIGIVQIGAQALADRYSYIPLIGIFIICVWGGAGLLEGRRWGAAICASAGVTAIAACAVVSRQQLSYWQNNFTLFEHALAVSRNNAVAESNLGLEFAGQRKYELAIYHFRAALEDDPNDGQAHLGLAYALSVTGKEAEAAEEYKAGLRLRPWSEWAHNSLGALLWRLGKQDEALEQYSQALNLKPEYGEAHDNLGLALAERGDLENAANHFALAVQSLPYNTQALSHLAGTLLQQNKLSEAQAVFSQLVRLEPANVEALTGLGRALAGQGQFTEATAPFREAARLCPTNANLHLNLGNVLTLAGQTNDAAAAFAEALRLDPGLVAKTLEAGKALVARGHYPAGLARLRTALHLQPDNADALNELAWALATYSQAGPGKDSEAVRLAERACALSGGKDARFWATLAQAYAQAGRFTEAATAAEKTQELALAAGQKDMAKAAAANLEFYRQQLQPK